MDSCCFAFDYDLKKVLTTPRGLRALQYGVNIVDSNFHSPTYWHRLQKYAERGYSIAVPGLLRDRISKQMLGSSYVMVKPHDLLLEVGKPVADIYVLADYNDGDPYLLGWEWGKNLSQAPTRDFGYGVINHYIPAEELRSLDELLNRSIWGEE